jgi:hypothetical protein
MPRKYTKKSDYWNKFKSGEQSLDDLAKLASGGEPQPTPIFAGDNFYSAASYSRNVGQTTSNRARGQKTGKIPTTKICEKYNHISNCSLPYHYDKGSSISARDSILLCQKAYACVPIFRNAVDVMAEFANSDIYLDGGSEKSRNFVNKWMEKIQSWKIKDQYFREFYRSGNVFIYKLDGVFRASDMAQLKRVYAQESQAKTARIPMRYVFLNPYDFVADRSITFDQKDGIYKKLLSEYDLERLSNPKTEYDKEVFKSLPEDAKQKIRDKSFQRDGVLIDLNADKLIYSFYKKQDYEPFAVPFGFPVLDDINWKMELKRVDQAISRTVENVILLITMGNTPDKGGVNPNNLKAMQELFLNESVGRALIADYTTKADFIIPDLNKVLGPEKYQIVNEDIKEGLQNIIVGKENYSSTQVKAQIFLERLKEARNSFLNDFLQPQIKEVCRSMGLKNFPTAKFVEIDIKDEVQLQRVASRLIEMGIITPEQGMTAIKQGVYPNPGELRQAQERLLEDREKGFYTPLGAAQPILREEDQDMLKEKHDMEIETQKKQAEQQAQQPKISNETGRPAGTNTKTNRVFAEDQYSRKDIQETVYAIEALEQEAAKSLRKHFNKKKLSNAHKDMLGKLVESVIVSTKQELWQETIEACIQDFDKISELGTIPEIDDISLQHELVSYPAAILYHSKNKEK